MYLFTDKKFEVAVSVVLLHEGGLTNNPNDPGGLTDFGISLRFLRAAGIDGNMNRSEHIGPEDIRALTPAKAKSIYYTYFYIKYNINYVQSQLLTTSILDMAVLMGGQETIWLLQIALNKLVEGKINVDGLLGQKTLALLNCVTLTPSTGRAIPFPPAVCCLSSVAAESKCAAPDSKARVTHPRSTAHTRLEPHRTREDHAAGWPRPVASIVSPPISGLGQGGGWAKRVSRNGAAVSRSPISESTYRGGVGMGIPSAIRPARSLYRIATIDSGYPGSLARSRSC